MSIKEAITKKFPLAQFNKDSSYKNISILEDRINYLANLVEELQTKLENQSSSGGGSSGGSGDEPVTEYVTIGDKTYTYVTIGNLDVMTSNLDYDVTYTRSTVQEENEATLIEIYEDDETHQSDFPTNLHGWTPSEVENGIQYYTKTITRPASALSKVNGEPFYCWSSQSKTAIEGIVPNGWRICTMADITSLKIALEAYTIDDFDDINPTTDGLINNDISERRGSFILANGAESDGTIEISNKGIKSLTVGLNNKVHIRLVRNTTTS